jgi:hypothetical protein
MSTLGPDSIGKQIYFPIYNWRSNSEVDLVKEFSQTQLNTEPDGMLRAASSIAQEYSNDSNVLGVLIRKPIPDDPDFPQTCDVELALVVSDLKCAVDRGYVLLRRSVNDVMIDVCAVSKDWLSAPAANPLSWILSLGDPRAFEVFRDYSNGFLMELYPRFKDLYLGGALERVAYWLAEAKRRLDAANDGKLEHILRLPEAAFSLVYLTCGLLDSSGRSFAGSFLKLPRKLRLFNEEFADELSRHLPAADKDPLEAANRIPVLASQLASNYPPISDLPPQLASEAKYNFSPLEVEYRSFVAHEIAEQDRLTSLWYSRAWATYLLFHYGTTMKKMGRSLSLPPDAFGTWRQILGEPDHSSIDVFVGWVGELYVLCMEACEEMQLPRFYESMTNDTLRSAWQLLGVQ